MYPNEITPLILTFNEAENIERTLASLTWSREIVVVDSGSTDRTLEILARHPEVRVLNHPFESFAAQCNFGLQQIKTSWTLSIDADYVCRPEFQEELRTLKYDVDGYESEFLYCISGKPLRASLYPPRATLFRTAAGHYVADGHAHRLVLGGTVARLKSPILHDDRKPLDRWLASQSKYADLEAARLLAGGDLNFNDRLRSYVVVAPFLVFFYCLLWKGLIFDGWPGVLYTLQRTYAELLLSLKLLDARITRRRQRSAAPLES